MTPRFGNDASHVSAVNATTEQNADQGSEFIRWQSSRVVSIKAADWNNTEGTIL